MNALPVTTGSDTPLDALERRLLDEFQHELPLTERPFAVMAERLGCTEREVIDKLADLAARGLVSRVGAVIAPRRVGASLLAAMCVPESRLDEIAAMVSGYPEVNHNYAREHVYNLWFVVVACDRARLTEVLGEIATRSGIEVLELPMERSYHIDLGFPLWR